MARKRRWRPTQRHVFVSYRRQNSSGYAGWLYDHLASVIGSRQVYIDVVNIPPGTDYTERVRAALTVSRAVLVLMGPGWHKARSADGSLRLQDPDDLVRREAEWARETGKQVIPVLVGGAELPAASDLPEPLQFLSSLTPAVLSDATWRQDVTTLVHRLRAAAAARTKKRRALIAAGVVAVAAAGTTAGVIATASPSTNAVPTFGPHIPLLAPDGFIKVKTPCYTINLPVGSVYGSDSCDLDAQFSPTPAHRKGIIFEISRLEARYDKSVAYATHIYLSRKSPAYSSVRLDRATPISVDGRAAEELTGTFVGTAGVTAVTLMFDGRGYSDDGSAVRVFWCATGYYNQGSYKQLFETVLASVHWQPTR